MLLQREESSEGYLLKLRCLNSSAIDIVALLRRLTGRLRYWEVQGQVVSGSQMFQARSSRVGREQ